MPTTRVSCEMEMATSGLCGSGGSRKGVCSGTNRWERGEDGEFGTGGVWRGGTTEGSTGVEHCGVRVDDVICIMIMSVPASGDGKYDSGVEKKA